jgi:hypothetical protein
MTTQEDEDCEEEWRMLRTDPHTHSITAIHPGDMRLTSGNTGPRDALAVRQIFAELATVLKFSLCNLNLFIKECVFIILHVVLYGCDTWPVVLREEHRLRVFENRVLR